ncbi:ABC transporter ATP-binding protein [Microbacterium aerolatum]|uniref:Multidrug ABC transporter ATP-binding protein n=1 Tax=Microbacterium aerolatum TaxID=153731 RepID=A0A511AKC7_9MICO|nr:ABC transporter ATP-binding protein [Microbacterium aerolatum]GEK87783.1 multidrug ABC transporter ATP-binding protein [Microbacterium aerolatum]GGB17682.1 multidrug ABC transporter ATP-binding protein [Microbacterium aerolatum]
MMNNSAVEITGLHVRRGAVRVFDGVDLTIPRGQITGLLGPSGCGKTTLMRSIVGVQKIASGDVTVLGEPGGSRQLRHRVAYGTQGAAVYGDLSVRQNLSYVASLLKAPKGDVDRVIDEVGLQGQAGQLVDSLSGGQSTRVSLGMALIGAPELVVLDEPTVGLDPVLRSDLWQLFRGLVDRGVTMVVSSHVMDEAQRCDRLLLMREGRIIADTTPSSLLTDTGTADPEAAFLALIERDREASASPPASASGDTRRSRREAREHEVGAGE